MSSLPHLSSADPGGCPCYPGGQPPCVCSPAERVLRLYGAGRTALPPLSPAQREECLTEIGRVEGYSRAGYAEASDADLARGVLCAWADFCRDKGLL